MNGFDSKDPFFRQWLGDVLKTEECTLTFTKVDGSVRAMRCTLKPEHITEYIKKSNRVNDNEDVFKVWDLENDGWRSIRYDSLKVIEFSLGKAERGNET